MHKIKKALLPLLLAVAMLVMAVSVSAASSTTPKAIKVSVPNTSTTYNGLAKKPGVVVTYDGKKLPKDAYSVTYKNNVKAGTASVIVKATKAPYVGTKTVKFTIKRQNPGVKFTGKRTLRLSKKKNRTTSVALVYKKTSEQKVTVSGAKLNATVVSGRGVVTVKNGKVTAKKVGRAVVRFSVKGNSNLNSRTITFIVKK